MALDWLNQFLQRRQKAPDYAEKTLAAYALGMKARGAIAGVAIERPPDCCDAARRLVEGAVYPPQETPRLPLADCTRRERCGCVYRPVMAYTKDGNRT
jgi:hypothetical protein